MCEISKTQSNCSTNVERYSTICVWDFSCSNMHTSQTMQACKDISIKCSNINHLCTESKAQSIICEGTCIIHTCAPINLTTVCGEKDLTCARDPTRGPRACVNVHEPINTCPYSISIATALVVSMKT